MIRITVLLFILLVVNLHMVLREHSFEHEQMKYERVKTAVDLKDAVMRELCLKHQVNYPPDKLFFRAFKNEMEFELWAKDKGESKFTLLKTFDICAISGQLGPKREEGDRQIPEGFYHIEQFNPVSKFHLSLRINYPNESDILLSDRKAPGSDIYIHGDCKTIGCLPMTDDLMRELYLVSMKTFSNSGSTIMVHIFPMRLNDLNYSELELKYREKPKLVSFWSNLKKGYDYFEADYTLPQISVDDNGLYIFQ